LIETGRVDARPQDLERLGKVLGVDPGNLAGEYNVEVLVHVDQRSAVGRCPKCRELIYEPYSTHLLGCAKM
jgi:hypothetical protein